MNFFDEKRRFLLGSKFPLAHSRRIGGVSYANLNQEFKAELDAQIDAYEAELRAMSDREVLERWLALKEQERLAAEKKRADEEALRPYNRAKASADCAYWSAMPTWTTDEAVALSFGRNPKIANWAALQSMVQISQFAADYSKRRELFLRGVTAGDIRVMMRPLEYITWAATRGIEFPAGLGQPVSAAIRPVAALPAQGTRKLPGQPSGTPVEAAKPSQYVAKSPGTRPRFMSHAGLSKVFGEVRDESGKALEWRTLTEQQKKNGLQFVEADRTARPHQFNPEAVAIWLWKYKRVKPQDVARALCNHFRAEGVKGEEKLEYWEDVMHGEKELAD